MRAGIGLVGVLLAVGLMVYLFSESELPKVREGEKMKEQARQISGVGQDSAPATESFQTAGQMRGSRLAALQVTAVTPGGAMDTYYGLKPGDEIIGVGEMSLDTLASDEELAKTLVVSEGYQRQKTLTVRRSGQRLTLPLPAGAAAAAAASGAASQAPAQAEAPAAPAPPPQPQKSRGLQGQLQDIQDAAGGGQQQD